MADLIVNGGVPISGRITPSGNKNAVLPMLCASLLTTHKVRLTNVPHIGDVEKICSFFQSIGSHVEWHDDKETISVIHNENRIKNTAADLPTGIRSSVLLLAPLLIKTGAVRLETGFKGCALGVREIDPHLLILTQFGCRIIGSNPHELVRNDRFRAQHIWADYASVTATETFIMSGVLAEGISTLTNAASEPHVQALCHFLNSMGARIEGIGTSKLVIEGVSDLSGTSARVPDDHHEVATFLAIGGVTGGRITVQTDVAPHMTLIIRQFQKLGLQVTASPDAIDVTGWTRRIEDPYTAEMMQKIEAAPWPYFPADLLPQAIGVSLGCTGEVMFWNKVYEGALGWSGELAKFGARVHLSDPHRLVVMGGRTMRPAEVEAPYIIRVVLALFIAALQIKGRSIIRHADPIRRAHPFFVEKLQAMGAQVEWT